MNDKNNGGPAFPNSGYDNPEHNGMSLRDYFAAKAMQGLLSNSVIDSEEIKDLSKACYIMADVMLKERDNDI